VKKDEVKGYGSKYNDHNPKFRWFLAKSWQGTPTKIKIKGNFDIKIFVFSKELGRLIIS